jgi:glycosyltransferase involved in cell wall biosynthesis
MASRGDAGDRVNSFERRLEGLRWRLRALRRIFSLGMGPHDLFTPLPPPPPPAPYQGVIDGPPRPPGEEPPESAPEAADDGVDPDAPPPPPEPIEVEKELVNVHGWATFRSGPTARVEIFLDDETLGKARIGVTRRDVAEIFEEPYVEVSGFELDVATPALCRDGDRAGDLRAVAFSSQGERHELPPVPVVLRAPAAADEESSEVATATARPSFSGRGGRRVLVVTHQLTLGGAQLYLMDLLREQLALGLIDPIVVSTVDGPLREELEELGVPVHITSLVPPGKLASHRGRLEEFVSWARPLGPELVFVNTSTSATFAGGEIAVALGVPSVWAIHESFEPALLWADLDPEVRRHAEAVIGTATSAIFEADATRHIYEDLIDPARCHTIPYGLELGPIDELRSRFDPAAARQRAEIPDEARLVVCVGTVEPRKAQVPLAVAFDLIGASHPESRLAFVGGRDEDADTTALEDCIAVSPRREQMEVIPVTPDVASWYGMADLLVCASDVESLPRTVLEAMAWGTPVLATSVFGLPELIDDGETGWLCEPRDVRALADALDRALSAPASTYEAIAHDGRALVETRHSSRGYAEAMAGVFEAAITSGNGEPA